MTLQEHSLHGLAPMRGLPGTSECEFQGAVGKHPLLREGEVKVLDHIMTREVAAMYNDGRGSILPPYIIKEEGECSKRSKERTRVKKSILKNIKTVLEGKLYAELPETFPVHAAVERYIVPDTDPREGLRGEWGCRMIAPVPEGTVLGAYQSLVFFLDAYDDALTKSIPDGFTAAGHDRLEFEVKMNAYALDLNIKKGDKLSADLVNRLAKLGGEQGPKCVVYSAYMYGNAMALINDFALSPLERGERVGAPANTEFAFVNIQGFPFAFVATSQPVATGEELRLDYGSEYWRGLRVSLGRLQLAREDQVRRAALAQAMAALAPTHSLNTDVPSQLNTVASGTTGPATIARSPVARTAMPASSSCGSPGVRGTCSSESQCIEDLVSSSDSEGAPVLASPAHAAALAPLAHGSAAIAPVLSTQLGHAAASAPLALSSLVAAPALAELPGPFEGPNGAETSLDMPGDAPACPLCGLVISRAVRRLTRRAVNEHIRKRHPGYRAADLRRARRAGAAVTLAAAPTPPSPFAADAGGTPGPTYAGPAQPGFGGEPGTLRGAGHPLPTAPTSPQFPLSLKSEVSAALAAPLLNSAPSNSRLVRRNGMLPPRPVKVEFGAQCLAPVLDTYAAPGPGAADALRPAKAPCASFAPVHVKREACDPGSVAPTSLAAQQAATGGSECKPPAPPWLVASPGAPAAAEAAPSRPSPGHIRDKPAAPAAPAAVRAEGAGRRSHSPRKKCSQLAAMPCPALGLDLNHTGCSTPATAGWPVPCVGLNASEQSLGNNCARPAMPVSSSRALIDSDTDSDRTSEGSDRGGLAVAVTEQMRAMMREAGAAWPAQARMRPREKVREECKIRAWQLFEEHGVAVLPAGPARPPPPKRQRPGACNEEVRLPGPPPGSPPHLLLPERQQPGRNGGAVWRPEIASRGPLHSPPRRLAGSGGLWGWQERGAGDRQEGGALAVSHGRTKHGRGLEPQSPPSAKAGQCGWAGGRPGKPPRACRTNPPADSRQPSVPPPASQSRGWEPNGTYFEAGTASPAVLARVAPPAGAPSDPRLLRDALPRPPLPNARLRAPMAALAPMPVGVHDATGDLARSKAAASLRAARALGPRPAGPQSLAHPPPPFPS